MKFFKHYTDASNGKSLQMLRRRFDLAGLARYWIFIELCASKLEKNRTEELTVAHCHFEFEKHYLMRSLGYANLKQTLCYLQGMAELNLCSVDEGPMLYLCSVPKLLECMDRGTVRARPGRAKSGLKIKIEKEIHIQSRPRTNAGFDFLGVFEKYPLRIHTSLAVQRFNEQIKTEQDYEDFKTSITHYNKFLALPENSFRYPKQSWDTYLGTKKSGYFWRSFISPECLKTNQPTLGGLSELMP